MLSYTKYFVKFFKEIEFSLSNYRLHITATRRCAAYEPGKNFAKQNAESGVSH